MTECREIGTQKRGKALLLSVPFTFAGQLRARGYVVFFEDGTRKACGVDVFVALFAVLSL